MARALLSLVVLVTAALPAAAKTGPREGSPGDGLFVFFVLFFGCPLVLVVALLMLLVFGLMWKLGSAPTPPRASSPAPPSAFPHQWEPPPPTAG